MPRTKYDRFWEHKSEVPRAPTKEVWFERAVRKLRAGRRCGARRALGLMAHMLVDVAQPMHTDGRLKLEDRVHGSYEGGVDA